MDASFRKVGATSAFPPKMNLSVFHNHIARIAISVYVLVAIIKKRLQLDASLYTILQILSLTLFEKIPLDQLLRKMPLQTSDPNKFNQLNLFD